MTPADAASFPPRPRSAGETAEDSISKVIAGWRATRPDLPVDPIAITARLARLHATLGPRLESVFQRFGIRGGDFAVIATLVRLSDARVSQRRLASELALSPGTVSIRMDRLLRRGLLERSADPEDGRGALLSLTPAGRELFEACVHEHLANAQALVAGLSKHERQQLGQLLGTLLYTLEEPDTDGRLEPELGLVVDAAPVALEQRRAVGLPPLTGLLVRHVEPAGLAASGGVRTGDLLRTANGRPLRSGHDLHLALSDSPGPRRTLALEIIRGAQPIQLRITAPITRAQASQ